MVSQQDGFPLDTLPAFDPEPVEQLRTLLGDEMIGELVEEFLKSGTDTLSRLDKALTEGDAKSARREVHGLKSAAASLGLMRLSQLCQDYETSCRDQGLDEAPALRLILQVEYDEGCRCLGRIQAK